MTMDYGIRQVGDVTILDLRGRLSLGEAVAFGPGRGIVLRDTVRELIQKGQRKFLLNLAGVTYADSSGVGQLVGALTSARNQGGELKVLNPNSQITDLLRATHLHAVFDAQIDEAAAIQSFSRSAAAKT